VSADAVIVGCGARTAVGCSVRESAAAVGAAIARIGEHPFAVDRGGEPMMVARASYLAEELRGFNRLVELGLPAALEAMSQSPASRTAIPLVLGLPGERPGLGASEREAIGRRFAGLKEGGWMISSVETVGGGHSAGLMAVEQGCRRLKDGVGEFCLVGGVDSYLEPETLEWLDFEGRLHSISNSWGFIPGEAAGFCLLASAAAAEREGFDRLGRIRAAATALEPHPQGSGGVCTGEGLARAFRTALEPLGDSGRRVDRIICDMNGERYRADEYGFAATRTGERFVDISDFIAPADCWGDVGAASGPLFIALAVAAASGAAVDSHTLVWTSAESGERSAVLVQHTDARGRRPE
jgi:3-oxoacyl-[acyl-carrier-protein] synthase-1